MKLIKRLYESYMYILSGVFYTVLAYEVIWWIENLKKYIIK